MMKPRYHASFLIPVILCLALPVSARFVPDGVVKSEDYTVLMAVDGSYSTAFQDFKAYKNVPIFNFEITQEGAISPESVEMFKKVLK